MRKKKIKSKTTDEVIVFSTQTNEENNGAEETDSEAPEEQEAHAVSPQYGQIEPEPEEEEAFSDDGIDGENGKKAKKAPLFGLFGRRKREKSFDGAEEDGETGEDDGYEDSEGVIIDIDGERAENYNYEDGGEEAETETAEEPEALPEKDGENSADNGQEQNTAKAVRTPVEYAKASDDLPVAEKSEDVYADIVKSIDETVHEERTSRRAKYEREQSFVDVQNPFQRDRETPAPGEENLSYEDVERKQLKTFDEIFASAKAKILPSKGEKKTEAIRKIVADVAVIVLICCGVALGILYSQSKKAEKQQLGLSSQIVDVTGTEEEAQLWEEFRAKYPNIKTPEGMMAKYAYLYAINQQLVGWVSVPNSGIDVQVVQSSNNKDYLKKDFYGNYSRYGCPFMDYRNDPRYLNQNTIIYGHHMSDGLIFAELSKYKELDGFLESPVIRFDTLYKTQYFKIYAAFITNTREEDDNGYVFNYTVTSFASTQNFDDYITALDERKLYTTGVDINSGDKLLTLSTCTYEFNDARLVIVARMLRTGETVDIDTTYAAKNGNPHYPQVWYDKNGKSNPFAGAVRWYPEG